MTRYPEPGRAKTRLIPALGAEGAARLHRRLAEAAVAQADRLAALRDISVELRFTGINKSEMIAWLGAGRSYCDQGSGNLGQRLIRAFQAGFDAGAQRVAAIGTDCPDLNAETIGKAFDLLLRSAVVLGPASDGGYYLVGVSRPFPELFRGISWGGPDVLAQTVEKAQAHGLNVEFLPVLNDIDRPEDLTPGLCSGFPAINRHRM